jgi:hypothetical protein
MKKTELLLLWFQSSHFKKLKTKMKLTIFLMLFTALQVNANNALAQELSFNISKTEVHKILKEIEKKQNCRFIYNYDLPALNKKVDLVVEKKQLQQVLTVLLTGTGLTYKRHCFLNTY